MRLSWRALPGVVLTAALLAPVAPVSAGYVCNYYQWNNAEQKWIRVAYLVDSDRYESVYQYPVDWRCKYCAIPSIVDPNGGEAVPDEVKDREAEVAGTVYSATAPVRAGLYDALATGNPFVGPDCPAVPPEWDMQ